VTTIVLFLSLLLSAGALSFGYYEAGLELFALGALVFAVLWLAALLRRWNWFSSLGLLAAVAAAGFGLWVGVAAGWALAGVLGALLAWDLTDLRVRLNLAASSDDLGPLERGHLGRLGLITLIGMLLASVAMIAQLRFSFEWGILLALAGTLGVTQLIGWLRRGGEDG